MPGARGPAELTEGTDAQRSNREAKCTRTSGQFNEGQPAQGAGAAPVLCVSVVKEMADYGGKVGVKVALENDWGLSADPTNMRIMLDEVNHPSCEASPDFCNWEQEYLLAEVLKAL